MAFEEERISLTGSTPEWVLQEHQARYRFAAEFVRGKVVADCSCGNGLGTQHFINAGAARLVAIDRDERAVAEAQQTVLGSPHGVTWVCADATRLPIVTAAIEVFVTLETLEHVAQDEEFLDEVVRVLTADGVCVVSTPNRGVTHPGSPSTVRPMSPFHRREYHLTEFGELLNTRFSDVQIFGQNPQPKFQARLFAAIGVITSLGAAARLNQLLKARRLLHYDASVAGVSRMDSGLDYEYLVAVCSRKRAM